MTNKYTFDTVNRLFKDLCRNSKSFGSKEIIVSEVVKYGSNFLV